MTKFGFGKAAVAATASLAMLVGLAACGSNGAGSSNTVQLTVWAASEDQAKNSSWLQTEEKAFEKAHPEYKITWKNSVVSSADAATTVKQDPSAAADVYQFANDQLGTLVSAQAIGELSDDAKAQVAKQNDQTLVDSVTASDGKEYGVPLNANTWFMYYNKSKFSDEDIKSLDTMLTKGKVSFNLMNGWYLPAFYAGAGMTIFGEKGNDAKAGVKGGDHAAEVTKYLVNLAKNPNFVKDNDEGAGLAALKNGTADVFFSGTWNAEDAKKALGDNYAAAQLPSFTTQSGTYQMKSFAGSTAVAYNPSSKSPKIAAQFAAFLGSTQSQKDHYTIRGVVPADKELKSLIADNPAAVAQMNTIANTSILQSTLPEMTNFWDPAKNFGTALMNGGITEANAQAKTEAWIAQANKASK
ncbi:extracellular solute-binding protein [Alloscardovia venturai]|uniref:Extracellular solute-binding protein n=1 Tax=Alloscardovia venturai TaxID=1769421 RepID=A0ABW2Y6K9_9BIFI